MSSLFSSIFYHAAQVVGTAEVAVAATYSACVVVIAAATAVEEVLGGGGGANMPALVNQSTTMTTPAITMAANRKISHPMHRVRFCFFFSRSAHDRACFKDGREPLEVAERASETVFCSSSRWTAMLKRRQKAGSRTLAMLIWVLVMGR